MRKLQQLEFEDAVVVGASGGIGRAFVDVLAARGVTTIHALSRSSLGDLPHPAQANEIDILDEASIAVAAKRIFEIGPVDLVVVATGLLHSDELTPEKSFRHLSSDALAKYFAVNTIGPALIAKHFLPLLPRDRRAVFACLSARVGSIGDNRLGGWYGYRASKAALNMLVRTLVIELGRSRPEAICVALHPGTVDTALSAPFRGNAANILTPRHAADNLIDVIQKLTPAHSGGVFAWDGSAILP